MLNKHLRFNFAFSIIAAVQLFSEIDPSPIRLVLGDFQYVVKPLIVIFLMAYLINYAELRGRFKRRILVGLLFGLFGDTFLMFTDVDELFFLLGLSSFLIGHLFYTSAFYTDYKSPYITKNYFLIPTLVASLLICFLFFYFAEPFLKELKIPVMIYGIVISLMVTAAASRYGKVNTRSFYFIFFGAILFLISDAVLAYHKFVNGFAYGGFVVMATYIPAQYLITIGTIERKFKKSSEEGRRGKKRSSIALDEDHL